MVVAENGVSNRYTVTTYTTEGRNVITSEPKMFELHRAKSLLTSSPAASPSSSSAASSVPYYRRPLNYAATSSSSNNVRDVYKKAASDYYEHEMPAPYGHGGGGGGDDDGGYGEAMNSGHGGYSGQEEHGYHRGQEISITPDHKPITLHYRTHSQPIVVHQTRIPGEYYENLFEEYLTKCPFVPSRSQTRGAAHHQSRRASSRCARSCATGKLMAPMVVDNSSNLFHAIQIIQEVVEIIQPYRKITQESECCVHLMCHVFCE